jgi:hypothetical protein
MSTPEPTIPPAPEPLPEDARGAQTPTQPPPGSDECVPHDGVSGAGSTRTGFLPCTVDAEGVVFISGVTPPAEEVEVAVGAAPVPQSYAEPQTLPSTGIESTLMVAAVIAVSLGFGTRRLARR